jgi:hypothetical protein
MDREASRRAALGALTVLGAVAGLHAAIWQVGTGWLGSVLLWSVVVILGLAARQRRG